MNPFLFFYANMIVTKNGVLNKVKLKLKVEVSIHKGRKWELGICSHYLNYNEQVFFSGK